MRETTDAERAIIVAEVAASYRRGEGWPPWINETSVATIHPDGTATIVTSDRSNYPIVEVSMGKKGGKGGRGGKRGC